MNAKLGDADKFESRFYGNPLITERYEGGINQVLSNQSRPELKFETNEIFQFVEKLDNPKYVSKSDTRVTGSDVIDSSLQEIFGYIIRDYVSPWYNLISDNKEFPEVAIRKTTQTFAINISNR